jgi:peptide-methionine (S)-S-oxide reductase
MGDHTEAFQVDYDPEVISYEEILQIFWDNHNPTGRSWSRQYMAIIFFHDQEQEKAALDTKSVVEKKLNTAVTTEIVLFEQFYLAEDYHQKYYLQGEPELSAEIRAFYPALNDFIDSTAAARLNGYIAGYGSKEQLSEEIGSYGLSPRGREILQRYVF